MKDITMNVMQKSLVLMIFLNAISWDSFCNAEIATDAFADRAKLYMKWVRHRITQEEYEAVKERMPQDCLIGAFMLSAMISGSFVLIKYGPKAVKEWQNLSQFKNKPKSSILYRPNDTITPEMQTVVQNICNQENFVEGWIFIGTDKVLFKVNGKQATLETIQDMEILNINDYLVSLREFTQHILEQDKYKDTALVAVIRNKDQTKHISYVWNGTSFIDVKKLKKITKHKKNNSA